MTLREARAFIAQHHRTHKAPVGGLFAIGLAQGDQIVGVIIIGPPVARHLDDGFTAEITRCCTVENTRNANSMLYAAARRASLALGYRKVITYTLKSESGESLRGAGYRVVAEVRGRSWNCASRPRVDQHPLQNKLRWEG